MGFASFVWLSCRGGGRASLDSPRPLLREDAVVEGTQRRSVEKRTATARTRVPFLADRPASKAMASQASSRCCLILQGWKPPLKMPCGQVGRRTFLSIGRPTVHRLLEPLQASSESERNSSGDNIEPLGRGGGGAEGALSLVQDLVDGLARGEAGMEAFLDSLPEARQDEWWGDSQKSKDKEPQWREQGLAGAGLAAFLAECMDACAARVLVAGPPPAVCRPLSSLRMGANEVLQRVLVLSHSGEEVVLCWSLVLEEALVPVYKGIRVQEQWVVKSVTGEPAAEDLPLEADPSNPPEAVVQTQLQALADVDLQRCYNFASPANRAAFNGNLGVFGSMLRAPTYSILLGHASHEVLETKQVSPTKFMAVCGVRGGIGSAQEQATSSLSGVFIWVCSLQSIDGPFNNCWLTDAVYRADVMAPGPPGAS